MSRTRARERGLDPLSDMKYDGVFLAGFGNDRIASGCHDDIWARVLVLEGPSTKVALVSVDFVGMITHGLYSGFAHARELVDPQLGLDQVIFSSTHSHEGPDTLGLWGPTRVDRRQVPALHDFVDRQVARAITEAVGPAALHPVGGARAMTARRGRVVCGASGPHPLPAALRLRRGPPRARLLTTRRRSVATLLNWSTHPESLEDQNELVSSDFIHFIRDEVEREGRRHRRVLQRDLGAAEIVGDTCVGGAARAEPGRHERVRLARGHRLRADRADRQSVGDAIVQAPAGGGPLVVADSALALRLLRRRYPPSCSAGSNIGVLDLDLAVFDPANCPPGPGFLRSRPSNTCSPGVRHRRRWSQVITAPGELFPELFYGVETHHRTDCPVANTGRPYEPSIRDAMRAPYRFLLGLSPDQFGYIVPGYDFYEPPFIFEEADDPCQGQQFDPEIPRRTVPSHYHESLSLGADMAAATTCHALRLLEREEEIAANAACQAIFATP